MPPTGSNIELQERIAGLLLGTAVGDALGLPSEGLTSDQIRRRWKGQWKMRFIFGRGMVSDDTEHTLMVAQALLSHPEDGAAFQRTLAWKFRWWFVGLPGGVGLATAKACLKLWIGFPAGRCAVNSAGSGPPMRSAVLGAYFADEPDRRREFVLASSRLTHRGWQAETAALAVAESVALTMMNLAQPTSSEIISALLRLSPEAEWRRLLIAI
jgi:ADP-ribosylglycohydrolase